ncbi:MAG: hypothetical protein LBG52_01695 [Candidatus Peribacteria bacterium]|jgi:hypothetical protein|nr:hypothetical protein [Candidatus Peribacteria bacterium]
MQTSVQKPNSIRLGSVIFEGDFGGGYVNLGALKGAVLNVSISSMQLVFDNAKMEPRNKINELTLTASLYEFNLQNFNEITGLGAFSSVDGTQTSATQSIEGVNAGQAVALEHQNGDGTPITSLTSITA